MKGYSVVAWNGISAPAKMPRPVLMKIHADTVKIINSPDFVAFLNKTGSNTIANTPEQFSEFFRNEVNTWAPRQDEPAGFTEALVAMQCWEAAFDSSGVEALIGAINTTNAL